MPWRPEVWLRAREEVLALDRTDLLTPLLRAVRAATERAVEKMGYTFPGDDKFIWDKHFALWGLVNVTPHFQWFGRQNVGAPFEIAYSERAALVDVCAASPLEVVRELRTQVRWRGPIVLVTEAGEFDGVGGIDLSTWTSVWPEDLLLRTDFHRFAAAAQLDMRQRSKATMRQHMTSGVDPYVLRCAGVTLLRGQHDEGYPFLEAPPQFTVIATASCNPRPKVQLSKFTRREDMEWFADADDASALVERLNLLGELAKQETELLRFDADCQGLRPIIIMGMPGCSGVYQPPRDAVANALKHWNRQFGSSFHQVYLCCRGDGTMIEYCKAIVNRPPNADYLAQLALDEGNIGEPSLRTASLDAPLRLPERAQKILKSATNELDIGENSAAIEEAFPLEALKGYDWQREALTPERNKARIVAKVKTAKLLGAPLVHKKRFSAPQAATVPARDQEEEDRADEDERAVGSDDSVGDEEDRQPLAPLPPLPIRRVQTDSAAVSSMRGRFSSFDPGSSGRGPQAGQGLGGRTQRSYSCQVEDNAKFRKYGEWNDDVMRQKVAEMREDAILKIRDRTWRFAHKVELLRRTYRRPGCTSISAAVGEGDFKLEGGRTWTGLREKRLASNNDTDPRLGHRKMSLKQKELHEFRVQAYNEARQRLRERAEDIEEEKEYLANPVNKRPSMARASIARPSIAPSLAVQALRAAAVAAESASSSVLAASGERRQTALRASVMQDAVEAMVLAGRTNDGRPKSANPAPGRRSIAPGRRATMKEQLVEEEEYEVPVMRAPSTPSNMRASIARQSIMEASTLAVGRLMTNKETDSEARAAQLEGEVMDIAAQLAGRLDHGWRAAGSQDGRLAANRPQGRLSVAAQSRPQSTPRPSVPAARPG